MCGKWPVCVRSAQTPRKKSVYIGLFVSLSASLRVAGRQLPGSLSARHFTSFEHPAASQRPPHSARLLPASAISPPLKLPTIPGAMLRMTSIGLSVDCTVCGAAVKALISSNILVIEPIFIIQVTVSHIRARVRSLISQVYTII